jgi:Putative DNA-binding domain
MRPVKDWEEIDLDELHRGAIMESPTLEYKDSRALGNTDHQKSEMFKDVSAFANSAGGILIYGMKESGHLPTGTDNGVDPAKITREWIENVLMANILPKIENLLIKPILLMSKGLGTVAYALDIPQATSRAPHQGPEHKYYRRYNFKAEPMLDDEVRNQMRRGIDYGRKFGAAFDLYIEISRICAASHARIGISQIVNPTLDQARISVSQDLRSAGSVLVLMSRGIRSRVGELIMRVDQYNSLVETRQPGSDWVSINDQLRSDLRTLNTLGLEICTELRAIMDNEP